MSGTLNSQPKRTDTRSRNRNTGPSTGGNKKSQKYSKGDQNEALVLLCELFPHWTEEDLASVLCEVNGDLETACNRIADGHANQWTAAGKKVPKPIERKVSGKKVKDSWAAPAVSLEAPAGSCPAPNPSIIKTPTSSDLNWGVTTGENITSITEEIRTISIEEETVSSGSNVTVKETTVVASVVQQVLQEPDRSTHTIVLEESSAQQTVESVEEEDFVVRLPSMPARKQAALEIEPSAVLLPFSVPIKSGSNISFGAPGLSKVVFGESKTPSSASITAPVSSPASNSAAHSSSPTAQKVYSPEELFASATRSSGQAYATTSVDAGNPAGSAPPGLGAPKSPYHGHQQPYEHQSMEHSSSSLNHTPQRRHQQQQQQMPFYGQRYDSYGSPSQQQHSFAQRFNPYAAQDESFGAVPPSSYYSGARQSQPGASAGYYHHPPHHYAPHVMYGADPYGATSFNAPPTTRYHPGSSSGSNYAANSAGQQQYQSPGSNSSRSRMF